MDEITYAVPERAPQGARPCPFCGSPELEFNESRSGGKALFVWICCRECLACGPMSYDDELLGAEADPEAKYDSALQQWNYRER